LGGLWFEASLGTKFATNKAGHGGVCLASHLHRNINRISVQVSLGKTRRLLKKY
jgi:hypothetical protein